MTRVTPIRLSGPGDLPSQVSDALWLAARSPLATASPFDETKVGKWLVFAGPNHIDSTWALIASGVERNGLNGSCLQAKTSTVASLQKGRHVICVYTEDFGDRDQVGRCLVQLRGLGIGGRLQYKTDIQTHSGVYSGSSVKASHYSSTDFEKD
jgi:hypothetical protein